MNLRRGIRRFFRGRLAWWGQGEIRVGLQLELDAALRVLIDGSLHVEPFYLVMGFAATRYGLAILGRASQKQVVNVAQRGGMCVVMIGHPAGGPVSALA